MQKIVAGASTAGKTLATKKIREHEVRSAKDFTDKELNTLSDLYKRGYIGRFTTVTINNERKRRGLIQEG